MIDRTRAISVGLSLAFHGALLAAGWLTLGRMIPPSIAIQGGTGADAGGGEFSFLPTSDDQTISAPSEWPATIDSNQAMTPEDSPLAMDVLPTIAVAEMRVETEWPGGAVNLPDSESDTESAHAAFGFGSPISAPSANVLSKIAPGAGPILAAIAPASGHQGMQSGNGDGNGIIAGSPVPSSRNKPPKYPEEARRRGLEGIVVLHLRIAEDGTVTSVSVAETCGHDMLDQSAIEAVKKWVFTPAMLDGKPQGWEGNQSLRFILRG